MNDCGEILVHALMVAILDFVIRPSLSTFLWWQHDSLFPPVLMHKKLNI